MIVRNFIYLNNSYFTIPIAIHKIKYDINNFNKRINLEKITAIKLRDLIGSEQLKIHNEKISKIINNSMESGDNNEDDLIYQQLKDSLKKLTKDAISIYSQEKTLRLYHDVNSDAKLANVFQVSPLITLLTLKILYDTEKLKSKTTINCEFIEKEKFEPSSEWNPDVSEALDFYVACKLLGAKFNDHARVTCDTFFEFNFNNSSKQFVKGAKKSAFGTLDESQDDEFLHTVDGSYKDRHLSYDQMKNYQTFLNTKGRKVTFYCKECGAKRTEFVKDALTFFRYDADQKIAIFNCSYENTMKHDINNNKIESHEFKEAYVNITSPSTKLTAEQQKLHLLLYLYNNKKYYGFNRKSKQKTQSS